MSKSLVRIVAPTDPVVSLDEARMQLRVDTYGSPPTNPEDPIIEATVRAAVQEIDAGTGWLGRAIAPQTWRLSYTSFPSVICLPYPPFIEILSITYVDSDGVTQTLTDAEYRLYAVDGDKAIIRPLYNESFPVARVDYDSVQITFRCGYESGSPAAADVPDLIKNAVKARVTQLYDSRGVDDKGEQNLAHIWYSLNSLRVWE